MGKLPGFLLGLCLLLGTASIAAAQENSGSPMLPPAVLRIQREFLKPGKSGSAHDRTESAFMKAMTNAQSPEYYLAMDALTGKPRALYLTGYDSFAEWGKDLLDAQKNSTFSAALDRAELADGELLDSSDQSDWVYREDQSLNQSGDLTGVRYFEIESFSVKPGHEADWDAAVKLVKDNYAKSVPHAHWAMYQLAFGLNAPAYLVITPLKSVVEIDEAFKQGGKFAQALGADGMKKLSDLSAAAIESSHTNIFAINPRQSYMSERFKKADPEFWRTQTAPLVAHKKEKTETKP
jgi:hypothetical protein